MEYEKSMAGVIKQEMLDYNYTGIGKARLARRNGEDGFEVGRGKNLKFIAFDEFWDFFSNFCVIDPETGEVINI
jgi:hypothetical protein